MNKKSGKKQNEVANMIAAFESAPPDKKGRPRESAFLRDHIRRDINIGYGKTQQKENMKKRGNPLSVIANEDKPNAAMRAKLMKMAKYNKNRGPK